MSCECEFERDPQDVNEDDPWHYRRRCDNCSGEWFSLHCPHDGIQTPCPKCGTRNKPREIENVRCDECGASWENTEMGIDALWSHCCQ